VSSDLYLGGYQSSSSIQHTVNEHSGFVGCVQNLVINQLQYDFRKSVHIAGERMESRSVSDDDVQGHAIGGRNIGISCKTSVSIVYI
jgi:hypothetical protein